MYLIDDDRVENVIITAGEICEAPGVYKSPTDFSGHASIDAMLAYVQTKFTKPIHLWEVAFQGSNVGSRLEIYRDRIEIAVRADQDTAWKRFCATKELIHLLIDTEEEYSPYGNDRIDEMLNKGLIGLASGNNPTGKPTQSELVAEVGAVEVLYPARQIIKDLDELEADGSETRINVRKAALVRQAPTFYVGTALRQDFRGFVAEAMKRCTNRRNGGETE